MQNDLVRDGEMVDTAGEKMEKGEGKKYSKRSEMPSNFLCYKKVNFKVVEG